ncbi:hypothetical protein [Curtobacterium sp. 20TX0008]|uniref:hypothetical protein n=1 Tax=Curtobacterium sp. 20TX0008 TaxID=3022018 RepID=UPI00232B929C|nr:hypothetical protein [Curtobacterium sp. 20TX0008]MDB6425902.1 hypothetical protein [Curtobacterium sp. 20TX0008]
MAHQTDAAEQDDYSRALAPLTGGDAVATRDQAREARAALTRASTDLARQQAEARADLERQRAELEERFAQQRAELEAMAAPLKEQLAKLTEVLWSVDLYLGRDETLRLVREGQPAPRETPIVVRQRVLVMAEESLLHMGRGATGMTSDHVPEFVEWLLEDDEHLDRVLPERKGVVVLRPTKAKARTGNVFENMARDEANERSYWLIRNGDRVYLLTVDPELRVGERLLPRRDEFTSVFERGLFGFGRRDGEPVVPGSDEWMAMERAADQKRRHFMRVLLVLQGLLDRTPALLPLPEGGASFLRLRDQDDGRIVLLNDADDARLLGTGAERFRDYQRRLNAQLRPGMRIIADFRADGFRRLRQDWHRNHPRISPTSVYEFPAHDVPHLIEGRRDGGLLIRFARTEKVERRNVPVPGRPGYVYRSALVEPTRRASCLVFPEDSWVLPFDLVQVHELEAFLASRDERSESFLSMVPTVRAAIAAKRAEAAEEAPFRELLRQELIRAGAAEADVDRTMDELVHWWKTSNLWCRPLNGDREHEARAGSAILDEFTRRQRAAADDRTDAMVAAGRALPGTIAVARDRQGRWKAYAPAPDTPGSEAMDEHVLLDVTTLRRDGTAGRTERGVVLSQRAVSSLVVAWHDDVWLRWRFTVRRADVLDGDERAALAEAMRGEATGPVLAVVEYYDEKQPEVGRRMAVYFWDGATPEDSPVLPQLGPLDRPSGFWGARRIPEAPVRMVERLVVRDRDGVRLAPIDGRPVNSESFGHYSAHTRWGRVPWWPRTERQYGDARARLVWADEDLLDRTAVWAARCRALAQQHLDEAAADRRVNARIAAALEAGVVARLEAAAQQRFDEDFPGAGDLWPEHLRTLQLHSPVHQSVLGDVVELWRGAGRSPWGRTLGEMIDFAAERKVVREDTVRALQEHRDVVVESETVGAEC